MQATRRSQARGYPRTSAHGEKQLRDATPIRFFPPLKKRKTPIFVGCFDSDQIFIDASPAMHSVLFLRNVFDVRQAPRRRAVANDVDGFVASEVKMYRSIATADREANSKIVVLAGFCSIAVLLAAIMLH